MYSDNRRTFLKGMAGILAAGFAPAVMPSGIIMPIRKLMVSSQSLFTGDLGIYNCVTITTEYLSVDGFGGVSMRMLCAAHDGPFKSGDVINLGRIKAGDTIQRMTIRSNTSGLLVAVNDVVMAKTEIGETTRYVF